MTPDETETQVPLPQSGGSFTRDAQGKLVPDAPSDEPVQATPKSKKESR